MTNTNTTPALVSALTAATLVVPAPRARRRTKAQMVADRRLIGRIRAALRRDPSVVARAIEALYRRQTTDEQVARQTRWTNERGFRQNHARRGSELAAIIAHGRSNGLDEKVLLRGPALNQAREIASWYVRTQLLTLAKGHYAARAYETELEDAEQCWAANDAADNAGTLGEHG